MAADNSISFADAGRLSRPLSFNLMLKPAGSLCNLDCQYCYYLDKSALYGGREPRMTPEMLERIIAGYMKFNTSENVIFNWHGGEPLVLGLDFFRKVVELERKYSDGRPIHNTIQTNGTLLDSRWGDFLAENAFLVGISIDGPEDIHDRYRRDKGGQPTWEKVVRGVRSLQASGVEFNTMTTVNRESENRGAEVYQFLKALGSRYMQFLPVVEHVKYPLNDKGRQRKDLRPFIVEREQTDAVLAGWSVSGAGWGRFICDVFDCWVNSDVGRYFVTEFDATLSQWCGQASGNCVSSELCAGNPIIEHNGDVYVCDHFVYPSYRLGNIFSDSLSDMLTSPAALEFATKKRRDLPDGCMKCKWLKICHGGCPKHRFNPSDKGADGMNVLCEGYRMYFAHVRPFMDRMREFITEGQSPAMVMMCPPKI